MKLNKVLSTLILTTLLSTGVSASNQDIKITIDGTKLNTTIPSKVVNNRTLVPMRPIFEAMGAKVDWDGSTKTVVGTKDNNEIELQIGSSKATINGKEVSLDSPAVIINSNTLVPVRFIAESLGSNVVWDDKTRTVIITEYNANDPYKALMETYRSAIKNQWEPDKLEELNLGPLQYERAPLPYDYGYLFRDLNNDGVQEMILGSKLEDGRTIIDEIYTIVNKTPVKIFEGALRKIANFYPDYRGGKNQIIGISAVISLGTGESDSGFYELGVDGKLELKDGYKSQHMTTAPYSEMYESLISPYRSMTKDEADAIPNKYGKAEELSMTPFQKKL